LIAALERMDAMLDLLQGAQIRAFAGTFDSVPTPSSAYAEAMAVLDDPEGTPARLAAVIGGDAGMSTAVLRVANSAYVGLSTPVASVQRAITLLGMDMVRALLTVAGVLRSGSDHPAVGRVLAGGRDAVERVRPFLVDVDPEVAQQTELAAMLRDVGALVLLAEAPEDYAPLLDLPAEERAREERARYGASSAVVGGYLLGVWGLPAPVMVAVARQTEPPLEDGTPQALLARALAPREAA
ncbi:MAG: HDOD domain-containing protein, partial [Myxococcales bacterium]|nr:HDOD domain-containing protein [Myxococcales bacterium]